MNFFIVLLLIILGSAFTIVFWVKWIGIILTMSHKEKRTFEKLPASVGFSFVSLLAMIIAASAGIGWLFNTFIYQHVINNQAGKAMVSGASDGLLIKDGLNAPLGSFSGVPMFFALAVIFIGIIYFITKYNPERIVAPYVGGELANDDIRGIEFMGPMDIVQNIEVRNYYLSGVFSEMKLALGATVIAIALILVMFGVIV